MVSNVASYSMYKYDNVRFSKNSMNKDILAPYYLPGRTVGALKTFLRELPDVLRVILKAL